MHYRTSSFLYSENLLHIKAILNKHKQNVLKRLKVRLHSYLNIDSFSFSADYIPDNIVQQFRMHSWLGVTQRLFIPR
jgi:hypothetical protein